MIQLASYLIDLDSMNPLFTHTKYNAIPIYIIDDLNSEAALLLLESFGNNWLQSQNSTFAFNNHKPIILPNKEGSISKILIKRNPHEFIFTLGDFYHNIPDGRYYLADADLSTSQQFDLLLGFALGAYEFNEFITNKDKKADKNVQLVISETINESALNHAIEAHYLTRTLINRPPNDLTTETFSKLIKTIADEQGAVYKEWVGEALLTNNFPLIYNVGQGSDHAPRLVELTYGNPRDPALTLVGKGVCFDTGGLDLKPASGMRFMKKDMGGAAHVLALAQWIMAEKWPVYLRVLLPIVENSVSGSAMRPGDIIRARSGLTVEIDNTDAEGRLILADALTYATEHPCDILIDFATLTGAARVALGPELPALFSTNDLLSARFLQSGLKQCDPLWRLPFFEGYKEWIKPKHADLANSASQPYGGAITAALFLKEFIPATIPYLHIDVMAWNIRHRVGRPIGGEAMGLRATFHALAHYLNITV